MNIVSKAMETMNYLCNVLILHRVCYTGVVAMTHIYFYTVLTAMLGYVYRVMSFLCKGCPWSGRSWIT